MTGFERSLQQRREALVKANVVRIHRARVKDDVARARIDADEVLVGGDPLVRDMRAEELLLASPGLGRVKVNKMFQRHQISPSKTIGGLSPRQRGALLVELRASRERLPTYRKRRALAEREMAA